MQHSLMHDHLILSPRERELSDKYSKELGVRCLMYYESGWVADVRSWTYIGVGQTPEAAISRLMSLNFINGRRIN